MEGNVIIASFAPASHTATVTGTLWQYDWGQLLKIVGLTLPTVYEVHFSNDPYFGSTEARIGTAEGVDIPNSMLKSGSYVYAFLVMSDEQSGETEYRIVLPVTRRPGPPSEDPTPEQQTAIEQAISALNAADGRAEASAAAAAASATLAGQYEAEAADDAFSASQYAGYANTAKADAEAARDAAQTAQAGAETARTGAQTAQAAAEEAQAAAESAQAEAEAAAGYIVDPTDNREYKVTQSVVNGYLVETFTEVTT